MTDQMILAKFCEWYTEYANIGRDTDKQWTETFYIHKHGLWYEIMPARPMLVGWIFGHVVAWPLDEMRRTLNSAAKYDKRWA